MEQVMERVKRPLVLSVVGWYLFLANSLSLLFAAFIIFSLSARQLIITSGQSFIINNSMSILEGLLGISCGIAILRGKKWGRLVYTLYFPLVFVIWCLINGRILISPLMIIIYLVILFLLNQNSANTYFNSEDIPPINLPKTIRKLLGSICFGLGSFILFMFFTPDIMQLTKTYSQEEMGSFIFLVLLMSAFFLIPGFLMWERKEWKNLIAVTYTTMGGTFVVGSIYNFIMQIFSALGVVTQSNMIIVEYLNSALPFINDAAILLIGVLFIDLDRRQKRRQNL